MKKIVVTFGLIGGLIVVGLGTITFPLFLNQKVDMTQSQILGFSGMILAFLMVFFGIRSYRENVNGGAIGFWKGVKVGILITLITCSVYVIAWEIVYYNFIPDFADKYAALTIDKMRQEGATDAAIAAERKKMEEFKVLYANPLFNIGVTYLEIFPVGLIMTLVSAAILRRKSAAAPVQATALA